MKTNIALRKRVNKECQEANFNFKSRLHSLTSFLSDGAAVLNAACSGTRAGQDMSSATYEEMENAIVELEIIHREMLRQLKEKSKEESLKQIRRSSTPIKIKEDRNKSIYKFREVMEKLKI